MHPLRYHLALLEVCRIETQGLCGSDSVTTTRMSVDGPQRIRWFLGGDLDLYGYALSNPVNFIDPLGYSAIGDIYEGILTAVTEGSKAAAYSVGQASKEIAHLAIHGDPYVKTALGVAAVSEVGPLACAAGIAAYEAYPTAMVTLAYGAVDFINSYLPGVPTFTQPGVAGAAASHVIEHSGVVVDAASELYGHLNDVTF